MLTEEAELDDERFDGLRWAMDRGATRRGALGVLAGIAGIGLSGVTTRARDGNASKLDTKLLIRVVFDTLAAGRASARLTSTAGGRIKAATGIAVACAERFPAASLPGLTVGQAERSHGPGGDAGKSAPPT